ncbi:uncharacterized protein LOC123270156 [Cotesia glomerata]|uniref:uncharacterized protein LOC123270156 n=1 Tax=Cotesia glomerata TaxID=32391 RepID=UPI001D02D714|nr:uncharacterized protein LOC123270156 [Cotesia glomerata]
MDNLRVPLEQKRVMIASKITKLQDELTAEGVKTKSINYRFTKVKESFEQYERLIEKLELTTPEDNEINLAEDVQTLFYDLMDQFEKLTQLNRTNHNNSHNVNTNNLNKLIDDARQHINNLQSLQINITESLLVRILENKLTSEIKNKWQETFTDNDTLPTFESFCEFVSNFAFRLSTHKPDKHRDSDHSFKRRRNEHSNNNLKKQKTDTPVRALVTTASSACPCCKHLHPLYKCYTFNALTVGERIKFVKSNKLCNNCLRVHKGTCTSSRCRICKKFHHTILHIKQNVTQQPTNPNTSKNNSVKFESPSTVTTDKESTS